MSNDDKLKVKQTESKKTSFKELTIIRDTIFWIDVVGESQNENAIFARPFNDKEAFPQKFTKNHSFKRAKRVFDSPPKRYPLVSEFIIN